MESVGIGWNWAIESKNLVVIMSVSNSKKIFPPSQKVAAVPGPPSLSWYHVIQSSIQPREELRRERLRSGDDYTISIDEYRDGAQEFSLRIPSVAPEHLEGSFRCEMQ